MDVTWRLVLVSREQELPGLPVSFSGPTLQSVWAEEVALRFGFHHGLVLTRNAAGILGMPSSVQKRAQPSRRIPHDVLEENVLLSNTPYETFGLRQVYKFSLICQD